MSKAKKESGKMDKAGFEVKFQKLFGAFGDFLDKYEEASPEWMKTTLLQMVYDDIWSLKTCIEDPEEKEITWSNPFVELQYPVDVDPLIFTLADKDLLDVEKVGETLAEGVLRTKGISVFRTLCTDTTLLKEGDSHTLVLSRGQTEYLNSLPEKKRQKALERIEAQILGHDPVTPTRKGKPRTLPAVGTILSYPIEGQVTGLKGRERKFAIVLSLHFRPLTLDRGAKQAYYPVIAGLWFVKGYKPTRWSEKDKQDFWNALLLEIKALIPTKAAKTPQPQIFEHPGDILLLTPIPGEETIAVLPPTPTVRPVSPEQVKNWIDQQFDLITALEKSGHKDRSPLPDSNAINSIIKELEGIKDTLPTEAGWTEKILSLKERFEKFLKVLGVPTFAIPSHPAMFTLLAMFAGKPERIPRKLLEKPHSGRTPEERKEADEFLSSILGTQTKVSYTSEGKEVREETGIALICDNPKIEARAEISGNLWSKDLEFKEEDLAVYIKRTFGAEGLRHLLGLIIGLEENFRQGFFVWNLNEHLQRLGYKKKLSRTYDTKIKKDATKILKIFTHLFFTVAQKDEKGRERIVGQRLFSIDGFEIAIFKKEIIDEQLKIRATDFWYKNAFEPKNKQAMYTKLLKKIARENHMNHPLTIYLAPLFAIFWRMNRNKKIRIKSLMDWCDLDTKDRHKLEDIRRLEAELNYMKERDYLGTWTNSGETPLPSQCKDPLECVLTVTPPEWLDKEIKVIAGKKQFLALPPKKGSQAPLMTRDELEGLQNKSGQSVTEFAKNLGISRQMASYIIHGKKQMTQRISDKVREVFGNMLPV